MLLLNSAIQIAAKPFPKAISPRAHAIIDYMTVGSFFMLGRAIRIVAMTSTLRAVLSLIPGVAVIFASVAT